MDLTNVTDSVLRLNIKMHVNYERKSTTDVLYHLKEIDRRRLFSAWKFKSLHEYAEKELGYSSDEAYRRIAAMKLLKEMPELENKIESGVLNLTNITMARTLFRKENYSREQKMNFLNKIENTSTRTAAKIIATISPETMLYDKIRPVSETKSEYRFFAPHELNDKLERLKGALAHSHPNISMGELIDLLVDLGLEKFVAQQKRTSRQRQDSQAEVSRQISERDQKACTNCRSVYAIEDDHIIPRAAGGMSSVENQRQLCRICNQRAAIEFFGVKKMEKYLKSPLRHYGVAV